MATSTAGSSHVFDLKLFEEELRYLVSVDSGSYCLPGLTEIAEWFGKRFERLGWAMEYIELHPGRYGMSVFAYCGNPADLDLLILSHHDTVFPAGSVAKHPFRSEGGRYYGPGVADMKAGALMALHALEQLSAARRLSGSVGMLLNAEEEISCPSTRSFIEEKSRISKVVISTEPARADGSCVRQRKGISRYKLTFHGKSAHSGVAPQDGACAVTEMARMILELRSLEDPSRGITINPGLVKGGLSVNTVPDLAVCDIDIRVTHGEDGARLDKWIQERVQHPTNPRVRIDAEGGITRPPMIPNGRAEALIEVMNTIGRRYGTELSWTFSGGGSDACFASGMGKPALCGLGPVGGGYHTFSEYVEQSGLAERMCIFRDFVETVANGKG